MTETVAPVYGRMPHLLPSPYQIIQSFGTNQSHGHSKELAALSKMYTNDDKYGGSPTESLNYKFIIFMDLCERAEVPQEVLPKAFPSMLRSMALEHYYSSCQGHSLTLQQLFQRFQAHFEGEEHRRNMLREWNSINLRLLIRASPDKNKGTVFTEMTYQLRQIQRSLDPEFQSDSALRNKIISACSTVPACGFAVLQQTINIPGLINNIHAAIENSEGAVRAERLEPLGNSIYFTDRKYYTRDPNPNSNPTHSNPIYTPSSNRTSRFQKKRCFVCGKEGCWSTKHSEKERQDSKTKFAKRLTNSNRYTSYIQEYEGIPDDDQHEIDQDMEALALEIDDEDFVNHEAENFVTSISTIPMGYAQAYYNKLSDQSTSHIITQSIPEHFLSSGRYTSKEFHGIMLDTGAARVSTAGHGHSALQSLVDTNRLDLTLEGWIERN